MQNVVATIEGNFESVEAAQKIASRIMRFAKIKNMRVTELSNIPRFDERGEMPEQVNKSPETASFDSGEAGGVGVGEHAGASGSVHFSKNPIAA